jgi:hypothetical protein
VAVTLMCGIRGGGGLVFGKHSCIGLHVVAGQGQGLDGARGQQKNGQPHDAGLQGMR